MEEIRIELREIRESQIRMEEDIRYHIKRTDILEDLHKDNARRITLLEEPVKASKYLRDRFLAIGKVAAAIVSIVAVIAMVYRQ